MELTSDFDEALATASRIHRKQRRKGSETPFIAHLLAVTAIALEYGATENEAIAAILHDAAEDQGGAKRLLKIHKRFGKRVAQIVEGCSDTLERPKPPWPERKEAFVSRLDAAPYSVRLVVAADKLHNARAISEDYHMLGEDLWSRFTGGRDGTLWYYRAVVDSLIRSLHADEPQLAMLTRELDRTISALAQLVTSNQLVESAGG